MGRVKYTQWHNVRPKLPLYSYKYVIYIHINQVWPLDHPIFLEGSGSESHKSYIVIIVILFADSFNSSSSAGREIPP